MSEAFAAEEIEAARVLFARPVEFMLGATSLATLPAVDVFIAHNSPRHVHDRDDEVHIGFTSFNTYITWAKPKLFSTATNTKTLRHSLARRE